MIRKILTLVLSIAAVSSIAQASPPPTCTNLGTRSEGWRFGSNPIVYDSCKFKAIVCEEIGTPQEGFYSYVSAMPLSIIDKQPCDIDSRSRPYCDDVGTRSEGWRLANMRVKYDICQGKGIVCSNDPSQVTGWYTSSLDIATRKKIMSIRCSAK